MQPSGGRTGEEASSLRSARRRNARLAAADPGVARPSGQGRARREPWTPTGVAPRVLRETQALEGVRELWSAQQRHPWSDLDFTLSCAARESGFVRPHVLVLEEDGRAQALLVASLRDEELAWRLGSRALLRSRARVLRVATGGLLGLDSAERARAVARELLASLERGEADALYLHEVERGAPLLSELARQPGVLQRDPLRRPVTGWALDLPGSYQEFRQGLSKKTRTNLNYTANLIQRRLGAELALVCYQRPADLELLLRDSEELARRTYGRRAGIGFADTPSARRVLGHALAHGWLRAHVLYAGARPIAFSHGLVYGRTFFGRHTGFDPAFADLRPGVFLLARIIEELCRERTVDCIDFGVMDNEFKRSFGTRRYERVSTYVFARGWKGVRLALGRALVGGLDQVARAALGASRARRLARRIFARA